MNGRAGVDVGDGVLDLQDEGWTQPGITKVAKTTRLIGHHGRAPRVLKVIAHFERTEARRPLIRFFATVSRMPDKQPPFLLPPGLSQYNGPGL